MKSSLFLLQSFDSLFPIGSFTLSNGMETYVQKEIIYDRKTLEKYLDSFLYVMPSNDLGFAAFVMKGGNFEEADAICAAAKTPRELREGSQKLCTRFIKAQIEISDAVLVNLEKYAQDVKNGKCNGMYPIALGLYFKDINVNPEDALTFYAYSQISTLVNHAVKLVPLGQLEGQKALYHAMKKIPAAVERALKTEIQELGFGGCGFDFRSMEHEKLYSRLYIS